VLISDNVVDKSLSVACLSVDGAATSSKQVICSRVRQAGNRGTSASEHSDDGVACHFTTLSIAQFIECWR
jgi:hypothetical protein